MKINKMTRNAFQILRCLNVQPGELVTTVFIAEKEKIPKGVVMRIITVLKENMIVQSHQGRGNCNGGFTLSRPLDQLTCLDIIEIMEGCIQLSDMKIQRENSEAAHVDVLQNELERIEHILKEEMARKTLADIMGEVS